MTTVSIVSFFHFENFKLSFFLFTEASQRGVLGNTPLTLAMQQVGSMDITKQICSK